MQRRVAIVNRGDVAVRLVQAVRELNARGGVTYRTVALHTAGDNESLFVREADEAWCTASAPEDGPWADLEKTLKDSGVDAAWAGWPRTEPARNRTPEFAELCERLGISFVGPTPKAARALAEAQFTALPEGLSPAGDGLEDPDGSLRSRLLQVQVLADGQGAVWPLGVRDCSVRLRGRTVLEESAAACLTGDQERLLTDTAVGLVESAGYRGACTVEFVLSPGTGALSLLGVDTGLQADHAVTEMTRGVDLLVEQLMIAEGGTLSGPVPAPSGHAVQALLTAQDPDADFAPAGGRVSFLQLPTGAGLRVDTAVAQGDVVDARRDPTIARIVAHGSTRPQALARLARALGDTVVMIEGGVTTKSFLLDLLGQKEVRAGTAGTGWIDRVRAAGGLRGHRDAGLALIAAGIEAHAACELAEETRFLGTARGGRPQAQHEIVQNFGLRLAGLAHRVGVARVGALDYRVRVDGEVRRVRWERKDAHTARLTVGDRTARLVLSSHAGQHVVEVDGVTHRIVRDEVGVVRSPAPALVVSVAAQVGEEIAAGAPLVVLESMKMETALPAPFRGRVREIMVVPNDQVDPGSPLLRLEPLGDGAVPDSATDPAGAGTAGTIDLPSGSDPAGTDTTGAPAPARLLDDLRNLVLGYDLTVQDAKALTEEYLRVCPPEPGEDPALLDGELRLFETFTDLCELTGNRDLDGQALDGDARVHSPREFLHSYLRYLDADSADLPARFRRRLARMLAHYGVEGLERSADLQTAIHRIFLAQGGGKAQAQAVTALLQRWLRAPAPSGQAAQRARTTLDRLARAAQIRHPAIGDLVRSVRFRWFDAPIVQAARDQVHAQVREQLEYLAADPAAPDRAQRIASLVTSPESLVRLLTERIGDTSTQPLLEILARRHYHAHALGEVSARTVGGLPVVSAEYTLDGVTRDLVSTLAPMERLGEALDTVAQVAQSTGRPTDQIVVDLYLDWPDAPRSAEKAAEELGARLSQMSLPDRLRRITVASVGSGDSGGDAVRHVTFRPSGTALAEDTLLRDLHPMVGLRLDLWRLENFDLTRLESSPDALLFLAVARQNPDDRRLIALAQIRELTVVRDAEGEVTSLPQAERAIAACTDAVRRARATVRSGSRLDLNHVWLHVWPLVDTPVAELTALRESLAPLTVGAGIHEVVATGCVAGPDGAQVPASVRFTHVPGAGVVAALGEPPSEPLAVLDGYEQKVLRSRRRNTLYPYELMTMLTGSSGTFVEHDLDENGALVPVDRPAGKNSAGIVAGLVTTPTRLYPEGMTRVVLAGDPTKALGAVAEPECARVIAGLDLAERLGVPLEWFTLSSGARISMSSGTENMDWVSKALRRIITFTQAGGEINIVVTGINVGAQPYWNAEATMLMHTKGILVMTPDSAMVLTGKQSLDYSGGVSAEDNFGIGGYDRVMGPNGQAQYWAPDVAGAVDILMTHYDHTYVVPGERRPRRAPTDDPFDRDICQYPHESAGSDFRRIGDIFSDEANPERKKPFDIRQVMRAVSDQDHPVLERWADMADADTSVVLDAHLGGEPVCLLGIESRPVPRRGTLPTDGPPVWTAGTLFPRSSKKTARAVNAASGNRPLVVLANLSGFDGSPESMRSWQLEFGAEIGRAVVNFSGPIVFCVVSRYHGGAFVVFSRHLHDNMQVMAVRGSFSSVIGGAPAAAVVFSRDVDTRTAADPRVQELERELAAAQSADRSRLRAELARVRTAVRSEKLGEVAAEFDGIHTIDRAVRMGSVDTVISPEEVRPRLIEALRRGIERSGA
ncbi:MAG: hypothetical protein QG608_254 [Actinomycetota bacterium]|nr:hypothetical protein [Actinomycetota bacterium]